MTETLVVATTCFLCLAAPLDAELERWSAVYGVDPELVRAVVWVESCNNPEVVSYAGARGLMQIMPSTAEMLGAMIGADPERILSDPVTNLRAGIYYLSWLTDWFGGDVDRAIMGYYVGPGAVGDPARAERAEYYLGKVRARFAPTPVSTLINGICYRNLCSN